jgi:hypothetical protein
VSDTRSDIVNDSMRSMSWPKRRRKHQRRFSCVMSGMGSGLTGVSLSSQS